MLSTVFVLGALAGASLAVPEISPFEVTSSLTKRISSGCGTSGVASCHNTTLETNLCCFESPGGLLLQTQFWDTDVEGSPSDSWTIHGLWPDHCDGSFSEDCDPSRDYTGISTLLEDQGATSTLDFMNQFWLNDDGSNEELWEHEWATHGTCYSTLQVDCLPEGSPKGAEAVAFFETVVNLFQTLPTFDWLEDAGITPSSSKSYSLSSLTSALENQFGATPTFDCDGSTVTQVSYYFNLKGSVIDGEFVPTDSPESGSCKSTVKYPPKSG
ncbi:base non-specific and adenylic acid preferential ribonuclease [Obba rivulosa]|uniref:ribonuclease T2 n=1 Tax=Obba rivulosa TaxID=1052685 RepID=A0A8E2AZP4_9APHY|nr:base non-specific and adenylic acid preferential ribonuclease [Obba rivulosa]